MWEKIRAVLIWPLSPCWDEGPNHFFSFLFPPSHYFLFVQRWPGTVHAAADRVDFTPASGHFQSQHIPDQLPYILFWPCNLSLSWSSMVPTQEWSAQRKKLMKSSFPLKCWSWASPVCTLSGLPVISELHTVTTGRVFTDRGRVIFLKDYPFPFGSLSSFTSDHFYFL